VPDEPNSLERRLDQLIRPIDLAAPSTTKFSAVDLFLAEQLRLEATDVATATISKAGNFSVRANQSARARAARVFVGVVPAADEMEATRRAARDRVTQGESPAVLLISPDSDGHWRLAYGVQALTANGILDPLRADTDVQLEAVTAAVADARSEPAAVRLPTLPSAVPVGRIEIDPRLRRMLRLAVASRPAVMLVGPPGTGKSQLLAELLEELNQSPLEFGFTTGHDAALVTPDESWSARELVGGETVDDAGRLRFTPGAILRAIADDQWLMLDEANRADLDRIFGPLLTWLSGQSVLVGRTGSAATSGAITLTWADTVASQVSGLEELTAQVITGEPVQFAAGTEWRMLGTYNALDAHRVFKFGLALGRRFAHVPVPAPDAGAFDTALRPRTSEMTDDIANAVHERVTALYAAHRQVDGATLGPALFLDIPSYVQAGVQSAADVPGLVAEAYLSAVGTWLARLEEDQLDALAPFCASDSVLGADWQWVREQLSALR
jgi:hypothetical protein